MLFKSPLVATCVRTMQYFPHLRPSVVVTSPRRTSLLSPSSSASSSWRTPPRRPLAAAAAAAKASTTPYQSEEPLRSLHLRLGQIFNREDSYIFRVTKNMRFYEWTQDEVETMFSDIVAASSTNVDDGGGGGAYELNQMLVIREEVDGRVFWEVADGQQRLITLCLLYCALRDGVDKTILIQQRIATKIQDCMIYEDLGQQTPRVTLRENHSAPLLAFLNGHTPPKAANDVQQRIVQNYSLLSDLIDAEKKSVPDFVEKFYRYLDKDVFVYLTIPESYTVARKLVGIARRGKDAEPIDDFKAMCVFMGIPRESDQDKYIEKWNLLEEHVTRKTLQHVAWLLAQGRLDKHLTPNNSVDILEEYWNRIETSGMEFFDDTLDKAARKLSACRQGLVESWAGITKQKAFFVADIAQGTKAEAIEIPFLLVLHGDSQVSPGYHEECLSVLERLALLFATTDIALPARRARVFAITKLLRGKESINNFDLTPDERVAVLDSLDQTPWGYSTAKRKVITAVLRRVEGAMLQSQDDSRLITDKVTLEHVLPQKVKPADWDGWTESEHNDWVHRLGNLCILNGPKNSKLSNKSFAEKKEAYKLAVFPLTRKVAECNEWTPDHVYQNHESLRQSCAEAFSL